MSDTVITTIKRVSLFKTPDNQVHESKMDADQHMDALTLKRQIKEILSLQDHEASRLVRLLVNDEMAFTVIRRMKERKARMDKAKAAAAKKS